MAGVLVGCILMIIIYLLGAPVLRLFYGKDYRSRCGVSDTFLHGICVFLGIAEAAHVAAVFLHLSVTQMSLTLAALLVICVLASSGYLLAASAMRRKAGVSGRLSEKPEGMLQLCGALLFLSVIMQVIVISLGSYRSGDMTFETVQTFLADNALYAHNPMTGREYTAGLPLRLKILCLPGLYAALCSLTGMEVSALVGNVIPVLVLFGSYVAYYRLGKVIFGENKAAVAGMLLIVSLLFWCGDYMVSMDGFQLLHCGYRGTAIRNGILVPFVLSMCLEKRYRSVLPGILAEACIVWTLYGLGACVPVVMITGLLQLVDRRREDRICRN